MYIAHIQILKLLPDCAGLDLHFPHHAVLLSHEVAYHPAILLIILPVQNRIVYLLLLSLELLLQINKVRKCGSLLHEYNMGMNVIIIIIMKPDYNRLSVNRQLFPRHEEFNTNRLICGHLNRLKFPPSIQNYLHQRSKGDDMIKSLAKASRCFCRRQDAPKSGIKDQLAEIQAGFQEKRKMIQKLQKIDITGSKRDDQTHKSKNK